MQINAQKREELGKKTKKLRQDRKVPAVVFGKGIESVAITIDLNEFIKVFNEAGETNLIDLAINGDTRKVLVKEVQVHPVNSSVLHVNFHEVKLDEKITAQIPVEILGEEENPVIKSGEGLALVILNEVEIEAFPTDLIDSFEVDVSGLAEIDAFLTVADLNYDKSKIEITGHEEDDLVVKIDHAVSLEEEEEELTEEELLESVEVTGEKEPSEDEEEEEEDEEEEAEE